MGHFNPTGLKDSKLSTAWREYVKQGNSLFSGGNKFKIQPGFFICGEKASLSISFTFNRSVSKGAFIVFDLPQGWGGWRAEKDDKLIQKSGKVSVFLDGRSEKIDVEIISRGSRLSIIQIHFLKVVQKGVVLDIKIPALLPCDRPGLYGIHAFISNSKCEPELIACSSINVHPGNFQGFDLIYPSVIGRNDRCSLIIRARSGYKSSYFTSPDLTGEAVISGENIEGAPELLHFSKKYKGINKCKGIGLTSDEGRINVHFKGTVVKGHPIISSELTDGYNLFFGDLHLHTSLSDGMGSPEEAYRWAKNTGLDFVALNDHVEDRLTYDTTWNKEKWKNLLAAALRNNYPGRFVTLPGIEVCGDVNIYFIDESFPYYPFHLLDGNEAALEEFLKEISKDERVIYGYHKLSELKVSYSKFPPPDLLEVIQHKREPERGLERFLPLCDRSPSFLGSTDSHNGLASSPPMGFSREEAQYGLTGIFAKKLTRKHIFHALKQARTFATSGQRSILYFKINQAVMGETFFLSAQRETITGHLLVRAVREVECTEIICNETVLFSCYPNEKSFDLSIDLKKIYEYKAQNGNSYFVYARIREVTGRMAWTSPVLVK